MLSDRSIRRRTIRNYRIFVRVAGPVFLVGVFFVVSGIVAAIVSNEYTLLLSGLSLACLSAATLFRTLMSTVRIVEREHGESEAGWRGL